MSVMGNKCNIVGIPENLLYLLTPYNLIQNLEFTSFIKFLLKRSSLVYLIMSCQIWKPVQMLTSKFYGINVSIGYKLVKQ